MSLGGVGPGDNIIDLSRSDSDAIRRARDLDHNPCSLITIPAASQFLQFFHNPGRVLITIILIRPHSSSISYVFIGNGTGSRYPHGLTGLTRAGTGTEITFSLTMSFMVSGLNPRVTRTHTRGYGYTATTGTGTGRPQDTRGLTRAVPYVFTVITQQYNIACRSHKFLSLENLNKTATGSRRAELFAMCICIEQTFMEGSAKKNGYGPAFIVALDVYVGSATEATVAGKIQECKQLQILNKSPLKDKFTWTKRQKEGQEEWEKKVLQAEGALCRIITANHLHKFIHDGFRPPQAVGVRLTFQFEYRICYKYPESVIHSIRLSRQHKLRLYIRDSNKRGKGL
ncbi:hypothetical protein GGX14DRAFT_399555 [Mycena pura]|uniref:Uncharacterized protein n=1 Tax=Mycena pura TaxID=153505 RepID=A0AAD6Y8M6_9AGAR|nr:hypothetical protein GGX14DRAFT_399555 [Mycena pura]